MSDALRLVECFQTFQGEGPDTGKNMLLVRFKKCNRIESGNACKFCDTQVKLRISHEFPITIQEVQNLVNDNKSGLLITGGEPTYKENREFTKTLLETIDCGWINVETNGSSLLDLFSELMVIKSPVKFLWSPKIFNAKDLEDNLKILSELNKEDSKIKNCVYIKYVVCNDEESLNQLDYFISVAISNLGNDRVYLMPEGKTKEELIQNSPKVFDLCEFYKCNFSSREHIIYNFL